MQTRKKALNYLHLSAPIAEASDNEALNSAANLVRNFPSTKLLGEKVEKESKKSTRL